MASHRRLAAYKSVCSVHAPLYYVKLAILVDDFGIYNDFTTMRTLVIGPGFHGGFYVFFLVGGIESYWGEEHLLWGGGGVDGTGQFKGVELNVMDQILMIFPIISDCVFRRYLAMCKKYT